MEVRDRTTAQNTVVRPRVPRTRAVDLSIRRCRGAIFVAVCLFVVAVSVHDATLVVVNHESIQEMEQNPVGRWLIEIQEGEIWLFVLVKLMGTSVAWAILISLYRHHANLGLAAAVPIAGFQLGLLCYLTLA